MAHSEPTKAFLKWSPETAMLSAPFGCTLPLSRPFCWSITYLQRSLQEVMSQDEILMLDPATSGKGLNSMGGRVVTETDTHSNPCQEHHDDIIVAITMMSSYSLAPPHNRAMGSYGCMLKHSDIQMVLYLYITSDWLRQGTGVCARCSAHQLERTLYQTESTSESSSLQAISR